MADNGRWIARANVFPAAKKIFSIGIEPNIRQAIRSELDCPEYLHVGQFSNVTPLGGIEFIVEVLVCNGLFHLILVSVSRHPLQGVMNMSAAQPCSGLRVAFPDF